MFYKIRTVIYILFLILFLIFVFLNYFSDKNINKIIKNRSDVSQNYSEIILNIPVLHNDTSNIFEYSSSEVSKKKVKKRFFWDLLNTNKKDE